jgi:hypothetical protein
MDVLSELQKEALKKTNLKAKLHIKNMKHMIVNKFIENDINLEYIDKIINYIKQHAYITTMIPLMTTKSTPIRNIFDIFIENPKLKSIFEIGNDINYLNTRKKAEDILFVKVYKDCENKERPKYGSLNIIENIKGDDLCIQYGDICLKYKDDIKSRTTFTFGDSFGMMMYICTFENLEHILYHLDIKSLHILIKIIDGNSNNTTEKLSQYIECQIHGNVDITRDIENIRISKEKYNTNKDKITAFINKYPNIEILVY